jgi:predicted NBD/HSP70 family sugar kinase
MALEKTPSTIARQASTRLVIERVLHDGPISRAEIARGTGLSKQTISEVMRELERDGWVREQGQVQGAVGRSAVTYAIRPDAAFVLGIDLGGTKLHLALADLHGDIVAEVIEPTQHGGGAAVIEQIGRLADMLVERAGIERGRVRGGVMGSPGIIDPRSGAIVIAPNVPGLDTFDVRAALRARLGIDVSIENDVNLAAVGERWRGGSRGARTFAFIALGTGIGLGIFSDGRMLRGARGAAGEIAYLPLGGDPYDARGRRLGTLETAVGSAAILGRYVALGGSDRRTVREIFDRLDDEAAARLTIDEVARVVATAILAIHSVIDPEIVVMGGSVGARPELIDRITAHLDTCMAEPVRVESSTLGGRATLMGAIAGAIDLVQRALFGVLGQPHQGGPVAHHELLPPALDQPLRFPGADDAGDRMQGCAGHFGDIATGDRKVDAQAGLVALAGLLHQPQHGMRHAALDLFGRHLADAGMGFVEAPADHADRVHRQMGIALDEAVPGLGRPGGSEAIDRRRGRARIIAAAERAREAEKLAGMDDAHDDLLAVARDLRHLQPAMQEHVERLCLLALLEDRFALRNPADARLGRHALELGIVHRCEERNAAQHAAIHGQDAVPEAGRDRLAISRFRAGGDKTAIIPVVQVRQDIRCSREPPGLCSHCGAASYDGGPIRVSASAASDVRSMPASRRWRFDRGFGGPVAALPEARRGCFVPPTGTASWR